jgi:hypothetical protein
LFFLTLFNLQGTWRAGALTLSALFYADFQESLSQLSVAFVFATREHRSPDSLLMIPPLPSFVKYFFQKNQNIFYIAGSWLHQARQPISFFKFFYKPFYLYICFFTENKAFQRVKMLLVKNGDSGLDKLFCGDAPPQNPPVRKTAVINFNAAARGRPALEQRGAAA